MRALGVPWDEAVRQSGPYAGGNCGAMGRQVGEGFSTHPCLQATRSAYDEPSTALSSYTSPENPTPESSSRARGAFASFAGATGTGSSAETEVTYGESQEAQPT
jgi:hypothetical protein